MPSPGALVVAVIALLVVGAVVQILLLAYRSGNLGSWGRTVDGDVVYRDDRINEMLYVQPTEDADEDLDFDPERTDTVACPRCDTLNEAFYSYCRTCAAELSAA